jgi:Na+/serine symporter
MSESLFLEVSFFSAQHSAPKEGKEIAFVIILLACLLFFSSVVQKLLVHFALKRSGKNVFKRERE